MISGNKFSKIMKKYDFKLNCAEDKFIQCIRVLNQFETAKINEIISIDFVSHKNKNYVTIGVNTKELVENETRQTILNNFEHLTPEYNPNDLIMRFAVNRLVVFNGIVETPKELNTIINTSTKGIYPHMSIYDFLKNVTINDLSTKINDFILKEPSDEYSRIYTECKSDVNKLKTKIEQGKIIPM